MSGSPDGIRWAYFDGDQTHCMTFKTNNGLRGKRPSLLLPLGRVRQCQIEGGSDGGCGDAVAGEVELLVVEAGGGIRR